MGSFEDEDEISRQASIGFPLGLALLLVVLCFMSGLLIACLHWNKLRSFFRPSDSNHDDIEQHAPSHPPQDQEMKKGEVKRRLPTPLPAVLMPGDEVPKFIAIACPCQPTVTIVENISVIVHKPLT